MKVDNHNGIGFLGGFDIGRHLVPQLVIPVNTQVGEHGDLDSLDLDHAQLSVAGPYNPCVAQVSLSLDVGVLTVIEHMVVLQGNCLNAVFRQHGHIFRRR